MWSIIAGFLASLADKILFSWWRQYKRDEAENVQNDVGAMPADHVYDELHNWERD